ncbi:acyltransferase [Haemophilus paracuniculus]|uniref:Acyltransferase n=1 Tax=Haemophilus paracuniculus TaxID=734 RepID=A0A1T0ASG6_9PAST|nr:acyltransferase family protein [Haemophilus paracuniculus]OOR99273.1 acyltransferase [Haemophilus paracuniculus]
MSYKHLDYRPEVDGLRALAILSVFIYHLNPSWLAGGFLGVDIFFVISGYLITRIITNEMASGQFSFKTFYQRRIKRIYPVFILVVALASIFSSMFFIRSEGELLRKTIELAPVFASNFYLAYRQGYWDMSANENPILHLWSLAVEEQYYLFFPIILFFAFKKTKNTAVFMKVVIGLFVFFMLTNFIPQTAYEKIGIYNIYYTSNLRFPELLVGSFIALLPRSSNQNKNTAISLISLFGLLLCLFLFNKDLPYLVGVAILLPCFLTASLIYSTQTSNIIKKVFSFKPMVWVGKLSYSLYLFHWLFIAIAHYITGTNTLSKNIVLFIIAATFICSIVSYYLLEQPLRKSKLNFKQAVILLYFIPSLSVIGYNIMAKKWVMERTNYANNEVAQDEVENALPTYLPTYLPPNIALIGDSHAGHLQPFLDYVGNKEGWKATFLEPEIRCYDLNAQEPLAKLSAEDKQLCQSQRLNDYSVIFVSMFYNLKRGTEPLPRITAREFKVENFDEKLKAMLVELAKTKKVYIFADIKVANRSPLRSLFLAKYGLDKFLDPLQELGNTTKTNEDLRQLVKDIPNVEFIDPTKYLPEGYLLNGRSLYIDQDHLSKFGSLQMGKNFAQQATLISEDVREKWLKTAK